MRANLRGELGASVVLAIVATVGLASCQRDKAPVVDTATAVATGKIGEHDPAETKCTLDGANSQCVGYTPLAFNESNSGALKQFVDDLEEDGNWAGASRKSKRKNEDNSKRSIYTVSAIRDSKSIRLKELGVGSLVMARIDVKKAVESPDKRFGITKMDVDKYGTTFYVVVTGYAEGADDAVLAGTPIATWTIYGFDKSTGKVEAVGKKSGRYFWCTKDHETEMRKRGAWFSSCVGATVVGAIEHRAADVLGGNSLVSALTKYFGRDKALDSLTVAELRSALEKVLTPAAGVKASIQVSDQEINALLKAFTDEPTDPAWMTCGIGCCTTEGT